MSAGPAAGGQQVTLILAGKPLTFTSRVEACKKVKIGNRYPPGPCPGGKLGTTSGGKKAVPKASEKAMRKRLAKQMVIQIGNGEKFDVEPAQVPALIEALKGVPPMNLANVQITGERNKNLFQHHLRDIPRDEMPALPDNVPDLMPFIQELGRRGVKAELVEMDPRDIQATQSQLSAPKVAKMAGFMKNGWMPGGAMIVSRENALGDGHHRWAGAAVAAMMSEQGVPGFKPVKVTALKVDLPVDDLLAVMNEFSGPRKALDETP